MTQAIAVHEILSRSGHEIVGVVAGRNSSRELPPFFANAFGLPVQTLPSPGFVFKKDRGVDVPATAWRTLRNLGGHRQGIAEFDRLVGEIRPDLILNFFEPLTGLWRRKSKADTPVLAVGHQYMIHHPGYVKLPGHFSQQVGMRLFVKLVGGDACKLALSLYPAGDLPERNLIVCPPILRDQLFELSTTAGDHVLAYLLNHGYREEIESWHERNRDTRLHCFYDKPGAPETHSPHPNLTFHRLNGEKFLQLMAGCRAVICTAGFESVSEAAWLGKPLFMVPVQNHVEQMINALDATNLGLGISAPTFELDRLRELPAVVDNAAFRTWVGTGEAVLERAIRAAVGTKTQTRQANQSKAVN